MEVEAIRGIAACVVLVHHCLVAFAPSFNGHVGSTKQWSLFGTPLYAFVNGSAAVVVFFVLSGFVLTYRAIETKNAAMLGIGAVKRWPRLALPVLTVNVLSAVLVVLHAYWNVAAGQESGSAFLRRQFRANPYPVPEMWGAVYEGTVGTFLFGTSYFNLALWTMRIEFFGSLLVFGLAYLFLKAHFSLFIATAALVGAAAVYVNPYYLCFLVGLALAISRATLLGQPQSAFGEGSKIALALLGITAVILFGYHEKGGIPRLPVGWYAFLSPIAAEHRLILRVILHTLAAVIVLKVALAAPNCLRSHSAALLGRLSFPIYLLHIPVMCSVGSWTYVCVLPSAGAAIAAISATVVTAVITFVGSIPLMQIDQLWLRTLRRTTAFAVKQPT